MNVALLLLAALPLAAAAPAQPAVVTVRADLVVGELRPIWTWFGYDEAGTTLTPEGRHLLHELNELSEEPIHVRVHHLLTSGDGTLALKWSSTNVYTEDAEGRPVYDWTRLDAIMDELTRPGIEPFVQAGFMPRALSSRPDPYTPALVKTGLPRDMVSGGAFHPPRDYRRWQELIEAWARRSGERYGVERASSWPWEPWNEPESPYWQGTREEFFALYDHFAAGVKRALPGARVGGPHVTDPGWKKGDEFMRAFLEHCRSGRNAATGATGAPLDFIAFHAKGTTRLDARGRVEMDLRNHLKTIDTYGRIIAGFPGFARLPIYLGESDPEGCAGCPATLDPERDYRRTSQFAAYVAASFMRKQDLLARTGGDLRGAVSWAFTFAGQPWFNGLRALTTNEVALPVLNAFKLLARMERRRLAVDAPAMLPIDAILGDGVRGEPDLGAVATVDAARRRVTVLLWSYHDVAGGDDDRREVELRLEGLPGAASGARWLEHTIDRTSGNAYSAWLAMGSPQPPSAHQVAELHAAAEMKPVRREPAAGPGGAAHLVVSLPRQSVKLIEIVPGPAGAATTHRSQVRIRDPFVLPVAAERAYYVYGTTTAGIFDGGVERKAVMAFRTVDLEHWEDPIAVWEVPEDHWGRETVWAPEVHRYRGRYYLFVTLTSAETLPTPPGRPPNVRRGTEILVADTPLGPFRPRGRGPQTPPGWMALDGSLWVEGGVPYMVFCHEWAQITDGSFEVVRLSEDLSAAVAEPRTLFHASAAPWVRCRGDIGELYEGRRYHAYVSDGSWLHRTKSGTLLMLWSSYGPRRYAVGIARSASGSVFGPWEQLDDPLWLDDGGHPMLFETFDGRLVMAIHQPNREAERARFFEIADLGDTLRIEREIGASSDRRR